MKIFLLIINIVAFLGSGFLFLLSLSGGSSSDPVFIGTLCMFFASLIGIIGMASSYKKLSKSVYYIFAVIGIGIPAILFELLSFFYNK
jgi:hypothetical protein